MMKSTDELQNPSRRCHQAKKPHTSKSMNEPLLSESLKRTSDVDPGSRKTSQQPSPKVPTIHQIKSGAKEQYSTDEGWNYHQGMVIKRSHSSRGAKEMKIR